VIQDGHFVYGNKSGCRITGLDPYKDVYGKPALTFVHPEDRPLLIHMTRRAMQGERIEPFEWRLHTVDGGIVWVMGLLMKIEFEGRPALLGNYIDITPVKQTRRELRRTSKKLEEMAIDLESIRQEERAQIGWELKENLGQTLAALREDFAAEADDADKNDRGRERLVHKVDAALGTIERIGAHLVPPERPHHDLIEAIRRYAMEFKDKTGIALKLASGQGGADLTQKQGLDLFHLFQEMAKTLARQGDFQSVAVRLKQGRQQFELVLSGKAEALKPDLDLGGPADPFAPLCERIEARQGRLDVRQKGNRLDLTARVALDVGLGAHATHILFAGTQPILMEGIGRMLSGLPDLLISAQAATFLDLMEKIRSPELDMVLLDTLVLGGRETDNLEKIKAAAPHLPILAIHTGGDDDDLAIRMLRQGASGYLSRSSSPNELIAAIHKVAGGRKHISNRLAEKLAFEVDRYAPKPFHHRLSDCERQVMFMIAEGKTMRAIAEDLNLSYKTIATYRARVFEKMNMHSDNEIVRYVVSKGLI
jgi:PAS domain S-box-containing protein